MNCSHTRIARLILIAVCLASAPTLAQDTRALSEPAIPPVCATLKATLSATEATSGEVEAQAAQAGTPNPALSTARIQSALDQCGKGRALELAPDGAHNAFLIAPIALPAGVTLLIDRGVTLYATRNAEYYAVTPGSCGVVNDNTEAGCHPLITARGATGSAIMGDGVIDGQGGARIFLDGKLAAKSWWDLAEDAHSAGFSQAPRLIEAELTDNFTLYRITLRNAPGPHLALRRGDGLTIWGVRIDSPKYARNTAGIVIAQSSNVTVTQSFIRDGDDNVAITAADGPTTYVTLSHNHFYSGHGMSIGNETSAGVSGVRVDDLTLDGSDSGIRIQSSATHGGHVEDIVYSNICVRDSREPITFSSAYSFPGKAAIQLPVYDDITLRNVRISGGGNIQFNGFDQTHRIGVTLDGVGALDNPARYRAVANHTDFTFGPGPVNLVFTGDDSTITGKPETHSLPGCAGNFLPFP